MEKFTPKKNKLKENNQQFSLKHNGDKFEKDNFEWISNNLPNYEQIWKKHIGNDGRGTPWPLVEGSLEEVKKRKRFYQAHYSMMVSARKIDILKDDLDQGYEENMSVNEQLDILFYIFCRIGHVKDMVEKIDSTFSKKGTSGIYNELQRFYELRNHIIHGPQIPSNSAKGLIHVPDIKKDWNDNDCWDDIPKEHFICIQDYIQKVRDDFFETLCSVHGKIKHAAELEYKDNLDYSVHPDDGCDCLSGTGLIEVDSNLIEKLGLNLQ